MRSFASLQPPSAACDRSPVGKACVPYFRGAEVAITRNAVDQRYVEQKRFRERCANELAVRKACSFQRGFLQVYVRTVAVLQNAVDERGALQRNAADAAAGKAAVSKRQPGKSPSVSVRFSNRTNSTSVSSSAACENSAARSAQREYCSCGVLCFISTRSIAHTATRVQQTKDNAGRMHAEKPNTGESLCSFVRQYVIMVSK